MIKNHLKIAWRNLFRHRMNSLINLSGLAIGMTAAFFIFMWVSNEYSYDSYHPDAERIYRLTTHSKKRDSKAENTPYPLGEDVKNQLADVELLTRIRPITGSPPTVRIEEQYFKEKSAAHVDENWFRMFRFDFIQGGMENFNSVPNSVVISESKSLKYFGQVDVVGNTLRLDDKDFIIQGIIRDAPTNSSFHYDLYLPVAARHADPFWQRFDMWPTRNPYRTYIKLSPSASPEGVRGNISLLTDEAWSALYEIGLTALEDTHFEQGLEWSDLKHGEQRMTQILLLLGVLLLAVACINYVNLTTARATMRVKEVSLKKIVGAQRAQLFAQFVMESALLAFLALGATLLMVWICLPWFNRFVDNQFTLAFGSATLWYLLGGTLLATVVLTSVYPAILLSSFKPAAALRGKALAQVSDNTLRKGLVVMQFSISIVLIIATVVIYSQMQFIHAQYDRYDKSGVFSFVLPKSGGQDQKTSRLESVRQELLKNSSIADAAIGTTLVDEYNPWGGFEWDGYDPDALYSIAFAVAGSNLHQLLNLSMKEGRWFLPDSRADEKNFIVNEAAVNELGIREPVIGQRFVHMEDTGVIVGVVNDFHYASLRDKIAPIVFSNKLGYANSLVVKSAPGQQTAARQAAEQVYKQFAPGEPFDYQFVSEEYEQLYREDFKVASLIWTFSMLAIFISCMGLYGLAMFSAERRHKEIGIRKALGATVSGLAALLSKDFVKLVFIAIVIASPIAWWAMNKWLEDFAYRIAIQWWMIGLAGLAAVVIALATVSFRAIRAARANPVDSLRDE